MCDWRKGALVACLLATGSASSGCLTPVEPDVGERKVASCNPEDTDPATDVSFDADILPLFNRPPAQGAGCTCHDPGGRYPLGFEMSGLDLTSHRAVMRGGITSGDDIVVPGDPCSSLLVQKVGEAPPYGARMPFSGPPYLSREDRRLIADWIAEGARDN